ncbi:MAG: hypothetical protein MUF48_16620 [Pirellulaceae bacterium]|nr:hypothetical protein [Pirellulaceae bacterium]
MDSGPRSTAQRLPGIGRGLIRRPAAREVVLILALIFAYAGTSPPDVNEAHYLTKAKRFWNPQWCQTDAFLDSADAHPVFYVVFGWPTRWVSLAATAWLGRLTVWALVAWAWQRLSWAVVPRRHLSVLTAAWFLTLGHYCHLAGEWAVGGLEAKSVAYALVLGGLAAMVRRRWGAMWLWLGAACAFHVLVGGWSLLAAAMAWVLSGPDRTEGRAMLPGLCGGTALALIGLLPALWLTAGVDQGIVTRANMIYVYGRLSHHLLWHTFASQRLVMFGLAVVLWVSVGWFARRADGWRIIHRFALGAMLISAVGVVLDYRLRDEPSVAAWWLRFYWYRLADVAVPLVVALGLPLALAALPAARYRWVTLGLWCTAVLVPVLALGRVYAARQQDFRPGAVAQSQPLLPGRRARAAARYAAWRDVCAWIRTQTRPDDRFLTPRAQQTFRWYAERAEVVGWKDIPQDPASIVQWWSLLQEIYPLSVVSGGLGHWTDEQLQAIAQEQQVDYILVDRAYTRRRLGLTRVYPPSPRDTGWFELYRASAEAADEGVLRVPGLPVPSE